MAKRSDIEGFRSRFGFQSDPKSLDGFRNRILQAWKNFRSSMYGDELSRAIEQRFAKYQGTIYAAWGYGHPTCNFETELESASSFEAVVTTIQNLLFALADLGVRGGPNRYYPDNAAGEFFVELDEAVDLSLGIDLRIQKDDRGARSLSPVGVPLLDSETIDTATAWLADYGDVQKEFRAAQEILAAKRQTQYRQAQDALRFALEKLLKILLKNNTRIEDQGAPLKAWLQSRGVNDDLITFFGTVLNRFVNFQNECVKYDSDPSGGAMKAWSDHEVEFLIYQAGAMIRFLLETAKIR